MILGRDEAYNGVSSVSAVVLAPRRLPRKACTSISSTCSNVSSSTSSMRLGFHQPPTDGTNCSRCDGQGEEKLKGCV